MSGEALEAATPAAAAAARAEAAATVDGVGTFGTVKKKSTSVLK